MQAFSDHKEQRTQQLIDTLGSPAELLNAAQALCPEAFNRLDADAVRNEEGTIASRPATFNVLRALESAVMAATGVSSVAQTAQAMAMAQYAAIGSDTRGQ